MIGRYHSGLSKGKLIGGGREVVTQADDSTELGKAG